MLDGEGQDILLLVTKQLRSGSGKLASKLGYSVDKETEEGGRLL